MLQWYERLPLQILYLKTNPESGLIQSITELFADDGEFLTGTSVASLYKNRMLIGTIIDRLAICDVNVPLTV